MTEKQAQTQKTQLLNKQTFTYDDVVDIMSLLRSPYGCMWDREQTHESIRSSAVEEAYELVDAINRNNRADIIEELGDCLLQFVLHCQIADDNGEFSREEVYNALCTKLIRRHSHIFGNDSAATAQVALSTWEKNKLTEHQYDHYTDYLLQVPHSTAALLRAAKVQKRAAKVGFDWDDVNGALIKVDEEIGEVKQAIAAADPANIEEEIGDALFALVNVARFCSVDPEIALCRTIEKFINRFEYVETALAADGITLQEATLAQMDAKWDEKRKPKK